MATIAGIEIYPLVSFIIFFSFFLVVAIWVWKGDKNRFIEIGNIPLEDE
jgi:hypothetical protein